MLEDAPLPADAAGVVTGDVLLAVDCAAITGADDFIRMLASEKIGRPVELELLRGGIRERRTLIPRERIGRD